MKVQGSYSSSQSSFVQSVQIWGARPEVLRGYTGDKWQRIVLAASFRRVRVSQACGYLADS